MVPESYPVREPSVLREEMYGVIRYILKKSHRLRPSGQKEEKR